MNYFLKLALLILPLSLLAKEATVEQLFSVQTVKVKKEQVSKKKKNYGYVTVDDIDATVAKVKELGGNVIVPPTDIPKVGRFSVFADPQGAVISAITYVPIEKA